MGRRTRVKAGWGFSLVELLIGVLLLSLVSSAVFAGFLVTFRRQGRSGKNQELSAAVENLQNILKLYAVPVLASGDPAPQELAALDGAMLGVFGCRADCRKLPGDACSWALQEGCVHDVSSVLGLFHGLERGTRVEYTVAMTPDGGKSIRVAASRQAGP